jgi:hypothetical protein
MIPGFFKLIKLLLGLIAITGLSILIGVTAITSIPYFTNRHYKDNESPSSLFYVVLESFDPHLNALQFHCLRWANFQEEFQAAENQNVYIYRETDTGWPYPIVPGREYRTYLSVPSGACSNISSDFKVQNLDVQTQVVRLQWAQEAFKVRNSYRVDDHGVIPLHLNKFMSAGIAINIFLVLIIALPMTALFLRFCHKKYGKLVVAAWALILVGLCTFNFAEFNRRLSLDPLSEDPVFFMFRHKFALMAVVIFFAGAAISFWLHHKKRLPARAQA